MAPKAKDDSSAEQRIKTKLQKFESLALFEAAGDVAETKEYSKRRFRVVLAGNKLGDDIVDREKVTMIYFTNTGTISVYASVGIEDKARAYVKEMSDSYYTVLHEGGAFRPNLRCATWWRIPIYVKRPELLSDQDYQPAYNPPKNSQYRAAIEHIATGVDNLLEDYDVEREALKMMLRNMYPRQHEPKPEDLVEGSSSTGGPPGPPGGGAPKKEEQAPWTKVEKSEATSYPVFS